MDLSKLAENAAKAKRENKELIKRLKKKSNGFVDELFQSAHEEVFSCIDCLQCANCCKTTGPLLTNKDVERLAKHLRMKPGQFTQEYLRIDEDDDYVFKSMPCPFLGADNYCSVYESRPKACREYPHLDRDKQKQILNLNLKNTEVCPAVQEAFQLIKKELN